MPSLVICELLGVPYADRDEFQTRTGTILDTSLPEDVRRQASLAQRAYMRELVERAQADPGEDMLGMLVREHGHELETPDLTGIASLLLLAGHETTSNMLGLGTLALLRHPDQLALVRDDPERVAPAVEELMRWLSIVHSGTPRVTTTEVEIAGRVIPAGEMVVFALPAANRDPELVDDPDALDITRKPTNHIGFGHGIHHCLGAPLARMEMRIAFPRAAAGVPGAAHRHPRRRDRVPLVPLRLRLEVAACRLVAGRSGCPTGARRESGRGASTGRTCGPPPLGGGGTAGRDQGWIKRPARSRAVRRAARSTVDAYPRGFRARPGRCPAR
ncbi:cytochrome P450 [Saccharopolyspora gregorii]|uniref:Cytochrome P450 n=1 Tax=Saccharopolyspora gregorii TaxID=33914 RepID=A0ABP6RHL4_9PSEU